MAIRNTEIATPPTEMATRAFSAKRFLRATNSIGIPCRIVAQRQWKVRWQKHTSQSLKPLGGCFFMSRQGRLNTGYPPHERRWPRLTHTKTLRTFDPSSTKVRGRNGVTFTSSKL